MNEKTAARANNRTNASRDLVRFPMPDDTWKSRMPECFVPANVSIYAPPRDWNVACAITQARFGVALTEAQRALVGEVRGKADASA